MTTLITGATGILGKYLIELNRQANGTWFTNPIQPKFLQLDVCNKSQVHYVMDKVKPDVIIHCAAIGSVDYVESNYSEAYQVNVVGTRNVLEAAGKAKFVYISSNAVFDGNNLPYNENSERNPINRYGAMKKEAEDIVMASDNWLIIRPFMLYGWTYPNSRGNPFTMFFNRLLNNDLVKAVNDIYWQPTNAKDAARVIWQLLEYRNEIFNIAPDEKMTLYDFALAIADTWRLNKALIESVPNSHFNLPASRPVDTSYDLTKLTEAGIKMMTVKEGLRGLQ